jgi:hypothetical protein
MSKLSTKDIKPEGPGGPSKTLEPGNQKCKINGVSLEEFKFKPESYHLILHMEGPDLGPEFEGFFLNKDDESMGRYKGAVGRVKASEWAYVDGTTKSGVNISRDQEILRFIKTLCGSIGKSAEKWLVEQDNKHDTIESLVTAFNTDQPFSGKYLNFCIAGKEYKSKDGYIRYDLFLPKFSRQGIPFETLDSKPSKLLKYNVTDHLKKLKVNEVSEFGSQSEGLSNEASTDFSL